MLAGLPIEKSESKRQFEARKVIMKVFPASIYLLKVKNNNGRKKCGICSILVFL